MMIEQLGDGGAGLGSAPSHYLLEQLAKLNLRASSALQVRWNWI
jgi:hypothetical protein